MPVWAITKLTQIFSFKWILWYANSCHGEPLSMLLDPTAIQEGSAWGIWKTSRGQSLIEKSNSYDDLMTDSQYYVYSRSVFLSMSSNGFFFLTAGEHFSKKSLTSSFPQDIIISGTAFSTSQLFISKVEFFDPGQFIKSLGSLDRI